MVIISPKKNCSVIGSFNRRVSLIKFLILVISYQTGGSHKTTVITARTSPPQKKSDEPPRHNHSYGGVEAEPDKCNFADPVRGAAKKYCRKE